MAAKVGVEINSRDISISHRVGQKRTGTFERRNRTTGQMEQVPVKPRSIIVKFVRRSVRDLILAKRSALKGTRLLLVPDLTMTRRALLNDAQTKYGYKNVWSDFHGNIWRSPGQNEGNRPIKLQPTKVHGQDENQNDIN